MILIWPDTPAASDKSSLAADTVCDVIAVLTDAACESPVLASSASANAMKSGK